MISTNPGEPLRQLEHIASGGELSRVMLALKVSIESNVEPRTPFVRESQHPHPSPGNHGLRWKSIPASADAPPKPSARNKSLAPLQSRSLCVTHLPQIATFADHHYVIEKKERSGRTRTTIRLVSGEERTSKEVARMLSGANSPTPPANTPEQMIKANG